MLTAVDPPHCVASVHPTQLNSYDRQYVYVSSDYDVRVQTCYGSSAGSKEVSLYVPIRIARPETEGFS
jgi:hypothetical protein